MSERISEHPGQSPDGAASGSASAREIALRSRRAGYLGLIALYNSALGIAVLAARRAGRLPERPSAEDLAIAALATQRLSRLITKDRVTSAVRSPFTRYEGDGGPGEVEEAAAGTGARRAVGELLVCPFCVAQWIAGTLCCGWLFAPRVTRLVTAMFAVVAAADMLQLLYKGLERRTIGE